MLPSYTLNDESKVNLIGTDHHNIGRNTNETK